MALGTIKLVQRGTAVSFGPKLPMERAESAIWWRAMWVGLLTDFYLARPAWLITLDPQPWSIMREFSAAPEREADGHKYLAVFENRCTKSLLQSIADSEDFRRGLLMLSSEFSDELPRNFFKLLTSDAIPHLPAKCKDVLLCVDDAAVLLWVNPSRSIRELTLFIANLSHTFGFDFEADGQQTFPADSSA